VSALIFNRAAGAHHRGRLLRRRVEAAARRIDPAVRVCECEPREVKACARDAVASGAKLVVACGGDGTVSSVAGVLAGTGVALGVVRGGTFNHFARDLGVPRDPDRAVALAFGGPERAVDVGVIGPHVFVNNCSIGVYAALVEERARERHELGRWLSLVAAVDRVWTALPAERVRLSLDEGAEVEHTTPLLFVGNNRYRFTRRGAGRRARLDEGVLSVVLAHATSLHALLVAAARTLFLGLAPGGPFDVTTARRLRLAADTGALRVAIDGEVMTLPGPLEIRAWPAALRVPAPGP
jgi:diacylglycerol kinase family enzyme